jgi:hypothetical protein
MPDSSEGQPSERELADLAALADGSLPPGRVAEVEGRIAASPRLQALLAEQRRALAAIHAVDEPAPPALRAAVAAEEARRPRPVLRHLRLAAGLAVVVAALALLFVLPGSETGSPTVAEAAQLATRLPDQAPPVGYPGHPTLLDLEVDDLPFPNWLEKFGWRAAGYRSDRLEGRDTRTLFYDRGRLRIGYTILAGDRLSAPAHARRAVVNGTVLHSFALDGRPVVTWERRSHTCVLSGNGVSREALVRLAAWKNGGSIPY